MAATTDRQRNVILEAKMAACGMKAGELADEMNRVLLARTGRTGELTDRTIRRLLSGQTRWPQSRARLALESVFNCTAEELGFHRPLRSSASPPPTGAHHSEDPVHRRSFLGAAAAAAGALSATPAAATPHRIGQADIDRLTASLEELGTRDQSVGGSQTLERDALEQAERAVNLLNAGSTTTRVRQQVYAVASDAATTAAWAAIDSLQPARAQQHLDRALTLAGLSGDSVAELRTWNNIAMLADQRGRFTEGVAAAQAARGTWATRKDPIYASLCHARAAISHSSARDHRAAERAIGLAEEALDRTRDDGTRPAWMGFYDRAELNGLACVVRLRLGDASRSEYHAHQALARLAPDLKRNRAYYTAHLALAQVRQGGLEEACSTADKLLTQGLPGSQRVHEVLRSFRTEAAATGSKLARTWLDAHHPTTRRDPGNA